VNEEESLFVDESVLLNTILRRFLNNPSRQKDVLSYSDSESMIEILIKYCESLESNRLLK
jgi:hypothetical protein